MGAFRKNAGQVVPSPLGAVVSMTAMHVRLGGSTVPDDVVLAAPASRSLDAPRLGLSFQRDSGEPVGLSAFMVVRGATVTGIDPDRKAEACPGGCASDGVCATAG